jgi:heme ABC exporter ATP-binding subunit CcmA
MAFAIRFRAAVALRGRFPVLAGVDLDVDRGEVCLLQGANGAGKTSLLRACAGLLPVVSGEAEVLGYDLRSDPRSVRPLVGLLGHATSLYDDLTVEDNLRFAVRANGGRVASVGPALAELGLGGRLGSVQVGRLSAGQRRRVALAALVAQGPELWLLDEPHAGLDAQHRDVLDGIIQRAASGGATVLIASHERDRPTALAGRILTMGGGQLAGPGPAGAEGAVGAAGPATATAALFPAEAGEPAHVA